MDGLNAGTFYHLRDDRTNRITESRDYHQLHVRLIADETVLQTYAGQVQVITAANMLARWCRRIEFGFPDILLAPILQRNGDTTLHQRITREVSLADPFGHFIFTRQRSSGVQYTLKIGGRASREPVSFTINAGAWHVVAGQGNVGCELQYSDYNPVGPAFAACVGIADAFKVATGMSSTSRVNQLALNLLDFRHNNLEQELPAPISLPIKLGHVHMVGVGSVGSAVVYLLAMLHIEGSFFLIDHDVVGIENLNRSPLYGVGDIGIPKVRVAERYLKSSIAVKPFDGRYDKFIEEHGRKAGAVDLLLPLANEFGVRSIIEHNLPPLQIYGTTTPDWGVNYHRHIPLQDDCSLCRFPEDAAQASFACSEAQVAMTDGKQVDAALPFLSMSAAIMVVADLLRLQMPGYPLIPNFAFIDFKGTLDFLLNYKKTKRTSCQCTNRSARIYQRYLATTRFAALSQDRSA